MTKLPCSVVVITKNEETRLRDCLKSVDWADEIIVVDDFSTDKTLEVAREFTDRVFQRKMEVEGSHRNYAYSLARHEWVLSLDADERVSVELKVEIQELFKNGLNCNGYAIARKNHIGSYWIQHGGLYPSKQIKLFKRDEFKYDAHAEVHPQAYMKDPRGELKSDIIHYTYRNFTDAVTKLDKQTDLEARKWFRENRKVGVFSIVRKMIDRFFRQYIGKKGYRDGVVGLFLAVNSGMYQFLSYAKYWEMKNVHTKNATLPS